MDNLVLYEHNRKAYEEAITLMDKTGKAVVIHPTGTGKSFIGFKLAQDYPDKDILWLAPSEYIFNTQIENLKKAVGRSSEEAEDIVKDIVKNLTFITYSKLMMNEDEIEFYHPDYIVLDEFHRCGAPEWGSSVKKLIKAYPQAKLLGLSATNIRYLDNHRDMAEELFDSNIASEISLGEAIAKKILPTPTYVISMYSYKEDLERLRKKVEGEKNPKLRQQNEKLIEKLKRALENSKGLDSVFAKHMKNKKGKYLVFCAGKEHMKEMLSHVNEWFHLVDNEPNIYAVYYDNPETSKEFMEFKADKSNHLRLLFCIDMLNEGIHVEDIDGVILLRPTISPILYLQQIGRGLSAESKKDSKPIIFDIVNNFDSLSSVDALQEEMEEAFSLLPCTKREYGVSTFNFQIIDELRDCRKIFKQLSENLSASWNIYYSAAKKYYEKNGSLKMPVSYITDDGLNLGLWLQTQRRIYAGKVNGNLSDEQIEKLKAIGMSWDDLAEQSFNKGCEELKLYKEINGNVDVEARYVAKSRFPLGKWLGNVRTAYKNGRLDIKKTERLNELGMIWDVRDYRWNLNYKEAKAYYDKYGNIQVPHDYVTENGVYLGRWIYNQIKTHNGQRSRKTPLTKEQEEKLESIGIIWKNKYDDSWDKKYKIAKAYYEQHGNLNISSTYIIDGVDIGKWISTIRLKMTNPASSNINLSMERIKQMNEIGMNWESRVVG